MLPAGEVFPPEQFQALLEKRAPAFGLSLSVLTLQRLSRFLGELDVARRRTNLTGPLPASALVDHALESVLGERLIAQGAEVIDIGSGAGFPGIPLALARPDLSVKAIEPRRKRAMFLNYVIRAVPVRNATVLQARISDLKRPTFDVATCRAVGDVAKLIGRGDFLKSGGALQAWTTEPQRLADLLAPLFLLERTERVPNSRRKVLSLYRKMPVAS